MLPKKFVFFLCLLFSFFPVRGKKAGLIPEITPILAEENVLRLKVQPVTARLFGTGGGLLFAEPDGTVNKFDFRSGMIVDKAHVLSAIDETAMATNGFLALKETGTDRWVVLDPVTMRMCGEFAGAGIREVVGINDRLRIVREENRLVFSDFPNGKFLASAELGKAKVLGCVFLKEVVLVLTGKKLLTFGYLRRALRETILAESPVSGFLHDRDDIYYGAESRQLIRFSLRSGKIVWKLKLGGLLVEAPMKVNGRIAALPLDQNAYFVNRNGSVSWWTPLDSIRRAPPVAMSENLAVFLMNGAVKFLNPRSKSVNTLKLASRVLGEPASGGRYVYYLSGGETTGETRMVRVGNRFGIDITAEPQPPRFSGRSITFSFFPRNLTRPICAVKLFDSSGILIVEKKITGEQRPQILWIPPKRGDYLLKVEASETDGPAASFQNELPVKIIDWNEVLRSFWFRW